MERVDCQWTSFVGIYLHEEIGCKSHAAFWQRTVMSLQFSSRLQSSHFRRQRDWTGKVARVNCTHWNYSERFFFDMAGNLCSTILAPVDNPSWSEPVGSLLSQFCYESFHVDCLWLVLHNTRHVHYNDSNTRVTRYADKPKTVDIGTLITQRQRQWLGFCQFRIVTEQFRYMAWTARTLTIRWQLHFLLAKTFYY